MNNDARYFFCLSGFVGFLLFFPLGWLVTGNALDALLRGCAGCLVFAVAGRALLGVLLRSPPLREARASVESSVAGASPSPVAEPPPAQVSSSAETLSAEELAIRASASATSEAAASSANALPQPGMEASA